MALREKRLVFTLAFLLLGADCAWGQRPAFRGPVFRGSPGFQAPRPAQPFVAPGNAFRFVRPTPFVTGPRQGGSNFPHRPNSGFFPGGGFRFVPSSAFSSQTFAFSPFSSPFIISRAFPSPFAPIFISPLFAGSSAFLNPFSFNPFLSNSFLSNSFLSNPFSSSPFFNPFFEPQTNMVFDPRFSGGAYSAAPFGPAYQESRGDFAREQSAASPAPAPDPPDPIGSYSTLRTGHVTVNGQSQAAASDGRPLVISSGQHTIVITSNRP